MSNSKIHTTSMSHETAIGILKLMLEAMQVYDGISPTPERINAMQMAIEDMELISKYSDAYHKGYKDGAEAVTFHEELLRDETTFNVDKLEKNIADLKRGAEHDYEDGENLYQAEYLKGYICALSAVEGMIDYLKENKDA